MRLDRSGCCASTPGVPSASRRTTPQATVWPAQGQAAGNNPFNRMARDAPAAAGDVRLFDDIADEETELLEEDLLDLTAADQK